MRGKVIPNTEQTVIVDGEVRDDVTPPAVWLHNWMYSIIPGPNFDIYVAGFCKNCKTAFTKSIAASRFSDNPIMYTAVDVDKFGCVGP